MEVLELLDSDIANRIDNIEDVLSSDEHLSDDNIEILEDIIDRLEEIRGIINA